MKEKYQRLSFILERLYKGEELTIGGLAKEYKTSTKTIQRDFKERLTSSMLVREGNKFRLKSCKKEERDAFVLDVLENLAQSISGAFSKDVYEILDKYRAFSFEFSTPLLCVSKKIQDIHTIQNAIKKQYVLNFSYKRKEYKQIHPLALYVVRNAIYLYAKEQNEERFFKLEEITQCKMGRLRANQESLKKGIMVSLFVYPQASSYCKTISWGENQNIIEDKDGSLIIEFVCLNEEGIMQEVLSQIPHIVILEPQHLKEKMERKILTYAKRCEIN